jgi:nitrate reductase (cytochrome), electron transfer subunit
MRGHAQQTGWRANHSQVVKPMNPLTYRRAVWVFGAMVITASASGYFMGLRQTGSQLNPVAAISLAVPAAAHRAALETEAVPLATRYDEQDRLKDGPNAAWENHLNKLVQPVVDYGALTNVTEAERALALRERASRRAFDGAPPVVPHPVAQDSAAACLACHGPGLVIKDKVASKMSHALHTSCTQCHVPAVGPRIPMPDMTLLEPLTENQFVGLKASLKGSRAWPQAPPTIPHSTLMRTDCLSCHGPQGLYGLRTPHPDRQSCMQCHAPGAHLDQYQFLSAEPKR